MIRPYVAGAVLFAVAMSVGRFAYTPLLVVMRGDAGLGVTFAGVLASANLAGYLAGALAAMLPAMSAHRVAVIRWSAIGVAVLTAAMAGPAWAWLAARLLTGILSGIVFVLTVSVMLDLATVQRSRWGVPVFFSGVGFGISAVGVLVPLFAHAGGSRFAWLALGVLSAAAVALVWEWIPRVTPPALDPQPFAAPRQRDGTAHDEPAGTFWRLAVVYGVEGAVYIVPATFLVAMIAEVPELARFAAFTWVVVGVFAAPSVALWTAAARRAGVASALAAAFALQALSLLVPSVAGGLLGALSLAVGLGVTFIGIAALSMSLGRAYWPARSNAAAGVLTVLYGAGQVIGPLVATHVAVRTGSYRAALPLAAAALLVSTGVFTAGLLTTRRGV